MARGVGGCLLRDRATDPPDPRVLSAETPPGREGAGDGSPAGQPVAAGAVPVARVLGDDVRGPSACPVAEAGVLEPGAGAGVAGDAGRAAVAGAVVVVVVEVPCAAGWDGPPAPAAAHAAGVDEDRPPPAFGAVGFAVAAGDGAIGDGGASRHT